MSNSLLLPEYNKVAIWEGLGNFAIKKYYKWPFSFFYRKKFKMILDLMDKNRIYRSTLDYGSGPAEIFRKSLSLQSLKVKCVDKALVLGDNEKFDLIVCASVLEFVDLKKTLPTLKSRLLPGGVLIGASPMDSYWSRLYFRLIKDRNNRNSKRDILNELNKHFWIIKVNEWFGLYFSFKAFPK